MSEGETSAVCHVWQYYGIRLSHNVFISDTITHLLIEISIYDPAHIRLQA